MHIKIFIRKLRYPWRYAKVKIPAKIGLSALVVKFGLVWPDLVDFFFGGRNRSKIRQKNLENSDSFLEHV